ncbi:PREDICTED: 8-oxo-dGDP phosphatase NUDT18 isoform X2 [Cyprinodon variegatus]|uniref:8-oxo-dGDP phosphatase NUDT18 isoform X2 n=1 Tax=Cyprinodon variegatus TaxID=28743 RepID=UPI000742B8F2|nr:PREDICTED: 8-oxo-dGDP phosphatase NUDT18 isoform X2 [Cyprinodon variegatus]
MELTAKERQQVEQQVEQLLSGQGSEVSLCDVGLELSKPAVLRKNVTYIVCGVVFNDQVRRGCEEGWACAAVRRYGRAVAVPPPGGGADGAGGQAGLLQAVVPASREGGGGGEPGGGAEAGGEGGGGLRLPANHLAADPGAGTAVDPLRLPRPDHRYHRNPWHPVTLPLDMSCRHVVQRILLVFVGADKQIWVLVVRAPAPHLPTAAALRTHAVTWASNMVVQEALPSSYYDHDVNTLGLISLQHNGRQHGKTDGVCLNTLVALVPDRAQRDEDGLQVEWPAAVTPPPVENTRYVWMEVQEPALKERLLQETQNPSLFPIQSLY